MNNRSNDYSDYSDEELERIHSASEKFEQQRQSDPSIHIESCMEEVQEDLRTPLFMELLAIEVEWRSSRGQTPETAEYEDRFPDRRTEIEIFFQQRQQSPTLSDNAQFASTTGSRGHETFEPGTLIGNRYTLVELIGEGGMGSVYLAEQHDPINRRVALKLIKSGMDSKSVLARFNAERQALALMDHPQIAKVFDGGNTQLGQPYFAMELVHGLPITQYCDRERLGVQARLELFVLVAKAVQHAHMKGIIHRDLKPANVLVTSVDGRPTPKIIDFGVAKAIDQKLNVPSFGATAFIVGTPAYMSPEQADPTSMDIDTRTDVYSLGVILYELLVGSPPHESQSSNGGAVAELLRLVRDSDSPRPSSKLSMAKALPKIAANRDTEPKKLTQILKSELDWIVLKALERRPADRYETATAFARDVERYLAGEMVEAQPPSTVYRLKKLAVRYKRYVAAAFLFMLVLLAGFIGTARGLMEAKKHEKNAIAEASQKKEALQNEARERAFAEAIADFVTTDLLALTTLEGRLDYDDQDSGLTKDSTLGDLLDRAALKLDRRSDLDPRAEARLRWMIGTSYRLQGAYPQAIDALQRSYALYLKTLGPSDPHTLETLDGLAEALYENGKYELAQPLIEDSLKRKQSTLGDEAVATLYSMTLQARNLRKLGEPDKAVAILERTLEQRKALVGPEAHSTLTNMYDLALTYKDADQRNKAVLLLEQTLKLQTTTLGLNHPDTNTCAEQLASLYRQAGQFEKALPLLEQVLEWTKANYGDQHPTTAYAMAGLAACYRDSGRTEEAIKMFEQALEMVQLTFGADHPNAANAMSSLAMAYRAAGEHERALPYFEKALNLRDAIFGPKHPSTLSSMVNLAACYRSLSQPKKAQEMNERCLELSTEIHGADHSMTLLIMENLAVGLASKKQLDQSIAILEKVLTAKVAKNGRNYPDTLRTIANLGINYRNAGRHDEAVALLEEVHAAATNIPSLNFAEIELLDAYLRAGKKEQGIELLEQVKTAERSKFLDNSSQLADQLAKIGQILVGNRAFQEAEPLLRECLAIRQAAGPENWQTFSVLALLGQSLVGQEKFTEAEPLLRDGYEGMKLHEASAPPGASERLLEAIDCIVELYDGLDQQDELTRWQDLQQQLQAESLP